MTQPALPALARLICESLEGLIASPNGFALESISPAQRAVCRVVTGEPLGGLASDETIVSMIGGAAAVARLPTSPPAEVGIFSGIRTFKSLMAAALAIRATQVCDVSRLGAGEIPRVSIVSLKIDLADVIRNHIVGALSRPVLGSLRVGEPTAEGVVLRHPSGRPVEIRVVAGARAGASLVARWSAGCVFDEAPRMLGEEDGVVNLDEMRRAVMGRLLPGAQLVDIGSPWAPRGPVYEMIRERHGKPGKDLVVLWCPAWVLNPVTWTAEKRAALQAKDPVAYRTDVEAQFADPESALISSVELDAVMREGPLDLPPEPGHHYVAAIDPATRGDSWTLVVLTQSGTDRGRRLLRVAMARQWHGSKVQPLDPDAVLRELADLLSPYGVRQVATDQYAADAIRVLAKRYGLTVYDLAWTAQRKLDLYGEMKTAITTRELELPPDQTMRADLAAVRRRVTAAGVTIELPRTSDGRHCDYAPALAQAIDLTVRAPQQAAEEPHPGSPEAALLEARRLKELALAAAQKRADRDAKVRWGFRNWR